MHRTRATRCLSTSFKAYGGPEDDSEEPGGEADLERDKVLREAMRLPSNQVMTGTDHDLNADTRLVSDQLERKRRRETHMEWGEIMKVSANTSMRSLRGQA